eukprot:scaffold23483_cov118-Skeletonema_dohrnii-CCMP3373.AAC.2
MREAWFAVRSHSKPEIPSRISAAARGKSAVTKKKRKPSEDAAIDDERAPKKLARKWHSKFCSAHSCTTKARIGGLCCRHGGKKLCSKRGCTNMATIGGVCITHGARYRQCSYDGCENIVRRNGLCIRRGEKSLCNREGCTNQAFKGGLCWRHGGKVPAMKDVQVVLVRGECAVGMEQRDCAPTATEDVQDRFR